MNTNPRKIEVAFLGESGNRSTFGAKATEFFFKENIINAKNYKFLPKSSHTAITQALWNKTTDFGVIAVENVVDGIVNESVRGMTKLTARGIHVIEEVILPVSFYLVAKVELNPTQPITIYTHPTAQGQCTVLMNYISNWITQKNTKGNITITHTPNNEISADNAANPKNENCAALVNWDGLQKHQNLELIALRKSDLSETPLAKLKTIRLTTEILDNAPMEAAPYKIGDYQQSTTRFWKIGYGQFNDPVDYKEQETKCGKKQKCQFNRTSILLNLDQQSPGQISEALSYFSKENCNLSMVYPIPIPGRAFEYSFILEYEDKIENSKVVVSGHIDHPDGKLKQAYENLCNSGISLNPPIIFGAYGTQLII